MQYKKYFKFVRSKILDYRWTTVKGSDGLTAVQVKLAEKQNTASNQETIQIYITNKIFSMLITQSLE
jgi:hypothetical protein